MMRTKNKPLLNQQGFFILANPNRDCPKSQSEDMKNFSTIWQVKRFLDIRKNFHTHLLTIGKDAPTLLCRGGTSPNEQEREKGKSPNRASRDKKVCTSSAQRRVKKISVHLLLLKKQQPCTLRAFALPFDSVLALGVLGVGGGGFSHPNPKATQTACKLFIAFYG